VTVFFALLCCGTVAHAQSADENKVLSQEEIQRALAPPVHTRSLVVPERGLARRQASQSDQSVNLNVPFELNSSTLKPQASDQLKQLELALNSASLANNRFLVAGHTDAKGAAQYNKSLSLKRAQTVKGFLVANGIDPKRLDTVGFGSEHLLVPDKPDDASNRRVEIRVISSP
jgi:outer membrane protein OmpA-like peptidoglycan-associated protein